MDTESLYFRALVPDYVKLHEWSNRDSVDYAPWIIGHVEEEKLSNTVLDELYDEWLPCHGLVDFSEFIDFLQARGYRIEKVDTPGVWSPM